MKNLISYLKNPLLWFAILIGYFAFKNNFSNDDHNHVVRSDGSGYYAYLPATLIYKDPSYKKVVQAEKKYFGKHYSPLYLYKNNEGRTFNKYFPGIAVLQLPFFGIACFSALISGNYIDGYSSIFQFCFLLGSIFYTIAGLFLFRSFLQKIVPEHQKYIKWIIILFYLATTLFFYSTITPNLSHHYSFFLFGLFAWSMNRLKMNTSMSNIFIVGLILGMIALVRPTNIIVVLTMPLFFLKIDTLKQFIIDILTPKKIFIGITGFALVFSTLFFFWKWQTGDWIVWGYMGEGFNFIHPKFIASLFSFRIGLFLHSPILILGVIGTIFLYKESKLQFIFWWLFFLVNVWIISSWWCWDYESPFGHRPFTEHLFFLIIPVILFVARYPKIALFACIGFAFLGILRYDQFSTGKFGNQRFTPKSYMSSLQFWKRSNDNRFQFTLSSTPYGKRIEHDVIYFRRQEEEINPFGEFYCNASKKLDLPRTTERYYYDIELEKKLSVDGLSEVYLVIDAYNKDETRKFYQAIEIFNDRYEAINDWKKLRFQGLIHDNFQEYEEVKFYIWNPTGKWVDLKNIKFTIDKYKS